MKSRIASAVLGLFLCSVVGAQEAPEGEKGKELHRAKSKEKLLKVPGLSEVVHTINDVPPPWKNLARIAPWVWLPLAAAELAAGRSVGDVAVDFASAYGTMIFFTLLPIPVSFELGLLVGMTGTYFFADDVANWVRKFLGTKEGNAMSREESQKPDESSRSGAADIIDSIGESDDDIGSAPDAGGPVIPEAPE